MQKYSEIADYKGSFKIAEIPVSDYPDFQLMMDVLLTVPANHCIAYFAVPFNDHFQFFCLMGCDEDNCVRIYSHRHNKNPLPELDSMTAQHSQFHVFELDMHEKYGIRFTDHPWLKPLRFPKGSPVEIKDYPFYSIEGEELHEVGVGPVHAGIIEPGHFRFICNGEKVLHLEIQLGYQHRGVEHLFVKKEGVLAGMVLSESIAGDTVTGHGITHATLMETLGGIKVSENLLRERMIALELERIAVHIGDTAALCTDTAFQFGQVVNEALRTVVINTTQSWCGNRFGKGLIRIGGTHYPLRTETIALIRENLRDVRKRYNQMAQKIFSMPSILNRFEGIGKVSLKQAFMMGAVGMVARSSGLNRDVRYSNPVKEIMKDEFPPVVFHKGDVWARGMVRRMEVNASCDLIIELLDSIDPAVPDTSPLQDLQLQPDMLAYSLTEGWRGEICHTAITDEGGKVIHYMVKDPSVQNWLALAIAVRNQEISDFPLCNKSFNLSYCGNDL